MERWIRSKLPWHPDGEDDLQSKEKRLWERHLQQNQPCTYRNRCQQPMQLLRRRTLLRVSCVSLQKKTNTFIATIKDEKTNWSWERDALVTDRSFFHPNKRKFNFYASTERQAMFVTFQFRFNLTLKRKALFALCACMLYVITLKPVTARGGSKFRKTQVVKLKVFTLPTMF